MRWYDPISERWRDVPDPPSAGRVEKYQPAPLSAEHARIWEAVQASATSSTMRSREHEDGS